MPQTGDGNSTLSPRDLRRFRRFEFFGRGAPRPRRGAVGFGLAGLLNPKIEFENIRKRRRRRGRKSKRVYFGAYSRHRVRDLDSAFFINRERDRTILGATVLGNLIQLQDGKVLPGLGGKTTAGSDLKPSLHLQETWDQTNPGPPYRGGGPFRSIVYNLPASRKVGYGRYTGQRPSGLQSTNYGVYTGSFVDNGFWLGLSYDNLKATSFSSFSNLSEYDKRAWDQLKPTIPKANLGQFLYELKDLPGQLMTSARAHYNSYREVLQLQHTEFREVGHHIGLDGVYIPVMQPKEIADHFLNHNFGWVPFLSDVQKLFDTWNNSVTYLSNIVRDNGVWVKRRKLLEESEDVSAEAMSGVDSGTIPSSEMRDPLGFSMCAPMTLGGATQRGFCLFQSITKRKVWATGQFKYYRPEFDIRLFDQKSFDLMNAIRRRITLYGLNITPTLIYKITPWSWLVDWFTGLGSYVQRLDDFVQDGITSRGLYVMETSEKVMTKTSLLNFYSGPVTLQFQRSLHMKQRKLADSPYGFNAPWQSLSPKQWAILGAIGISRSGSGYISRGA